MKRKQKMRANLGSEISADILKRQKTGDDEQTPAGQPNILQTMLEAMPDSNYKMQQEEHLRAVEREHKLQKSRELKLK